MRRAKVIGALCLAVVTCLTGAISASAAPADPFQYKFSFGEELGTTLHQIVVNHQTGNILVVGGDGNVHQFDSAGKPVEFSAVGSPEVPASVNSPGSIGIQIDNSGGPSQGNFYTWGDGFIRAYHADGTPDGESSHVGSTYGPGVYQPSTKGEFSQGDEFFNCFGHGPAVFVAPNGTVWVTQHVDFPASFGGCEMNDSELVSLTPGMVPTGEEFEVGRSISTAVADGIGNVYAEEANFTPEYYRLDLTNTFAALGSVGFTFAGERPNPHQLAIDPSTNDAYLAYDWSENTNFFGFKGNVIMVPASAPQAPSTEVLSSQNGLRAASGVAFDATGQTLYLSEEGKLNVFHREPPSAPRDLAVPHARQVRSYGARLEDEMIDGGAVTTYRFEYGTTTSYGAVSDPVVAPRNYYSHGVSVGLVGLMPGTTYHVRMVATNSAGTTYGPDGTFTTYPAPPGGTNDPCPNALARKQTTAQRLPDCRAYELASAADTGGYDVESYLAPGQNPFPGFPLATDKLLYATHSGAVPGPWNATNKGPDPYVATRTASGWSTNYEGLPSNLNPAAGSFSSVLGEADQSLSKLAFAGPNLCSPCFTDGGLETGIPVRMPNGQLLQGMAGSLSGSVDPSAKPEGKVARYFSGDGQKLVFASKYAFEPGANDQNGSLTVYERDLGAGQTEVVSTDPSGSALTGTVSELGVSGDGSRVAIGKGISTDPQGNEYVHPYLHLAGTAGSVDLAPTTTSGVLYAGMSEDGSKVFFTTPDQLTGEDTDTSSDLYEADVDSSGDLSLKLVSASSSDACSPVANEAGEHWNTTGANVDCSAVAISGGGGVASATGAAYFLSPEQLNGEGTLNQPNLYLATPGGSLQLVATLEPNNPLVLDSVKANMTSRTADFQTTPSGNYAAFTSNLDLTSLPAHGFRSVYRYAASSGQLDCASCDRTGTSEASIFATAELPPNGLALLEDGRLFFTTAAQLSINDANARKDVFEWSEGDPLLISAGTGPFDSALLTASADGTDVFFFTHDDLAPEEDHNGSVIRIYDAREGGGFFKLPPSVPCQASDECHGPGTATPGPADIKSSGKTTQGNVVVCAKSRVKKRGVCVKKAHAKKHHKKKHARKKGAAKKRAAKANGKRGGRNA